MREAAGDHRKSRDLSAAEAAEALGVTLPTLYAYVSRGLLRSEPTGGSRRTRRYSGEDVQRLLQRRQYRRDPSRAAVDSMRWGAPVLETGLTEIAEAGPRYRGRSAVELARTHTIEDVSALLWTGDMAEAPQLFSPDNQRSDPALTEPDWRLPFLPRVQVALIRASVDDLQAYERDGGGPSTLRTGARILRLTAAVLAGSPPGDRTIAEMLRESWCRDEARARRLLDAALVLCADHELSVSSFAARVVASAETPLYGVVVAALAGLQGLKHGGVTELVEALMREAEGAASVRDVIAARLRRGERIPGFGQRLYPSGDPRSTALLELLDETHGNAPERQLARDIMETVEESLGLRPNIDFALVTLARTLHLPSGSGLALFTLGRTVGSIAHAIEQYRSGQIIRPRATYVGPG